MASINDEEENGSTEKKDDEQTPNLIPLAGSERAAAPQAVAVEDVDPDKQIEITVRVRPRQPTDSLSVEEMGNLLPSERSHYSRAEMSDNFGADPADLAAVEAYARRNGLEVVESSAARRSVILSGTIAALTKAFGNFQLKHYDSPTGRFRGRVGPILIPAELENIIEGVFGFDNRRQAKPHAMLRPEHVSIMRADLVSLSYTPPQVGQLYNFPPGLDGTGQCIGIIEFGGGFIQADLDAYFQQLGLPTPTVTAVPVDHVGNQPTPPDETGDTPDGEVMLDIEVAGAIAPKAKIVVYFAPFTERGWVDVLTTAIHDTVNKPSVISISWGWPEGNDLWTPQAIKAVNDTLKEAAAMGITICCASGDDGSADELTDGRAHVDFPAASPYILSCGGTTLRAAQGVINSEVVWNNGPRDARGGASGGGVSEVFPLPTWQANAHIPKAINTRRRGRGVPDVSGDADPNTGYRIRVRGQNGVIGGTSAVAPLWAGLLARINQRLGQPVGYLNPLIYNRLSASGSFRDIVFGSNDPTGHIGGYTARPGWDPCTGWGSPNGAVLLNALSAGPHAVVPGVNVSAANDAGMTWNQLPGRAFDIAVGANGAVWMLGTDTGKPGSGIFQWQNNGWVGIPGAAISLAVGPDGNPWIVNPQTQVLRWLGNQWQQLPGAAYEIAVGANGAVWAIGTNLPGNTGFGIYTWNGTAWQAVPGAGIKIAVGPDGNAWVINSQAQIFRWNGNGWQQLPGNALDIGVGTSGEVWVVGTNVTGPGFGIYHWINNGWVAVEGAALRIAVGPPGSLYIVDANQSIYAAARNQ